MIVGRELEQKELLSFLADAEIGAGALVVRGAPGTGKTTLIDEAVRTIGDRATVVRIRGIASEVAFPYGALAEICAALVTRVDLLPSPQRSAVRHLLSMTDGIASSPLTIATAILSIMSTRGELDHGPATVLVVDDAQWLDPESGRVLAHVARRAAGKCSILIGVSHDANFDLVGLPTIVLGPLTHDASRELLRRNAAGFAPHLRDAVLAAAEGNPFALVQLPAAIRAQGAPVGPSQAVALLPTGLAALFDSRLDLLDDEAQLALLVVATSGRETSGTILRALHQLGLDASTLERAEAEGLITIDGQRVSFGNPLLRTALHARATAPQRRHAHQALADVTEGSEQAWHLADAAIGIDARAADALAAAAEEAWSANAYWTATDAWRKSAELTPPGGPTTARLVRATEAAQLSGRNELADHLCRSVLDVAADPVDRLRVLNAAAGVDLITRTYSESADLAVDILANAAADPEMAGAALIRKAMQAQNDCQWDEARRLTGLAAQVAGHRFPYTEAMTEVLVGNREPGIAALQAPPSVGDGAPVLLLVYLERLGEVIELFNRNPSFHDTRFSLPARMVCLGIAHFAAGDLESAESSFSDSMDAAIFAGAIVTARRSAVFLSRSLAMRGRFDDARAVLDRCGSPSPNDTAHNFYDEFGRGFIELSAGNPVAAARHLGATYDMFVDRGMREPSLYPWAFDLVDAAVRAGDLPLANAAGSWLRETSSQSGSISATALSVASDAFLAEGCDDDGFRRALSIDETDRRPFHTARIRLLWGARLHRANRRTDAREQLRLAKDAFETMGAVAWAEKASVELRAAGESVPRRDRDELSSQELAVAAKAATGATVKSIAADLFLSAKTVEGHLSAVYRKLGVTGRVALAEAMRARG